MPNERISMSKLKQLIGLQSSNLSVRALARALGLSVGAVSKYLRAVRACGIEAAEAETLPEVELERRVFGPTLAGKPGAFVAPDCAWIHGELKRHRHVTLQLLWEEYAGRYGVAALPAQRVLPDLSALGEAPEALDAPATLRRREAVCRLRWTHGADLRARRRGGVPGAPVRQRHGRERLRLRRGHAQRVAAGLARQPRAGAGVLRGGPDDPGARQPQGRRHQGRSLRAGAAALVRGAGRPLPLRGHPRASLSAEG